MTKPIEILCRIRKYSVLTKQDKMCGILFCFSPHGCNTCCRCKDKCKEDKATSNALHFHEQLHELLTDPILTHRGPDISKQYRLPIPNEHWSGWMRGCVLHLRGDLTPQPLTDDEGNALLWNAEIFGGVEVSRDENDTRVLFNLLTSCDSDADILQTLEEVQGPWAFIFWQAKRRVLWFGRDMFGRRSLLWHLPTSPSDLLTLTSVAVGTMEYTEVPPIGLFSVDFSASDGPCREDSQPSQTASSIQLPVITLFPWHQCKWPGTTQEVLETLQQELPSYLTPNHPPSFIPIILDTRKILKTWIPEMNKAVSRDTELLTSQWKEMCEGDSSGFVNCLQNIFEENESYRVLSEEVISVLQKAVNRRVNNLPVDNKLDGGADSSRSSQAKIAVLFSGGLDSSVLAALLDRCLPCDEPIDLLNVAFEQPCPIHKDTKRKQKQYRKGKSKCHKKKDTTSGNTVPDSDGNSAPCVETTTQNNNVDSVRLDGCSEATVSCLTASCQLETNSTEHSASLPSSSLCSDSFRISPEENSRIPLNTTMSSELEKETHDPYDVPDRRTGRIALSELNPNRRWNFVEINVSQTELRDVRSSHLRSLIYPLQSVLDDSIGCAVWFAARGRGFLANDGGQDYISKAKVILCGMAADEQFAGYSRHRAHFDKLGEEDLIDELEHEMQRISVRNLGRDDRVIADHGKEARFPFLDEDFTKLISGIPVHIRANLHLPRGIGEKLLLRLSALSLGLKQTACQPKRAIQFGSKIAKLENGKEKGSDICHRL